MKHRYQKPNESLSEYVRTVLIIEDFGGTHSDNLPSFTNGMPALLCRTEKDPLGHENITSLTFYGKSVPPECWTLNPGSTIIAYFFKPFILPAIFNIPAAKLLAKPLELCYWNPQAYPALRTQLVYAVSTARKIEVLDNLLLHQLEQNKRACEIIMYATDQIM